jgi:hypothetical protein
MAEPLKVTLRDGRVLRATEREVADVEGLRRSFVNCAAGLGPFVVIQSPDGRKTLKIYSDEIVSVS